MFDDIENKSESLMRIVLLREKHILTKMHVQAERLYFYSINFYSIPVDPAFVRPSVRPCVNIFKLEYLRNQWANRI